MVGAISHEVGIRADANEGEDSLIRVIDHADQPIDLKQILQGFTSANRPAKDVALQRLRQLVEQGRLFEYPAMRGNACFLAPAARRVCEAMLAQRAARRPESKATILREVGKLALVKSVTKAELERQFKSLLQESCIRENPPLLGTRTPLYSHEPPRASEYVADALARLAKKLNRPVQGLFAAYQAEYQHVIHANEWSIDTTERHATIAQEPVAAPEQTDLIDERVVEAMLELNPHVSSGDLVSIAALRRQLETALPGSEFDRAVLRESAAGRLSLHRFDRPALITDANDRSCCATNKGITTTRCH